MNTHAMLDKCPDAMSDIKARILVEGIEDNIRKLRKLAHLLQDEISIDMKLDDLYSAFIPLREEFENTPPLV